MLMNLQYSVVECNFGDESTLWDNLPVWGLSSNRLFDWLKR